MLTEYIYQFALVQGGITYSLQTQTQVTDRGYAVSPYPFAERRQQLTELSVQSYISDYYGLLSKADHCLGLWYNTDNEEWYFDVVQVVLSSFTAKTIARDAGQLAYFDLMNKREVRL